MGHHSPPGASSTGTTEWIARIKEVADEVHVKLITSESTEGEEKVRKQLENLVKVQEGAEFPASNSTWPSTTRSTTARSLPIAGGRSSFGPGQDIFQFGSGDAFDLATRLQEYRQVKAFGITYIREGERVVNDSIVPHEHLTP